MLRPGPSELGHNSVELYREEKTIPSPVCLGTLKSVCVCVCAGLRALPMPGLVPRPKRWTDVILL